MKKLFLTLAIATASLIGSAQSLKYEVRDLQQTGTPGVNADSTEAIYPYVITVGIEGDTFGFVSPNSGNDVMKVSFAYKTKYSDDEKYKLAWAAAVLWVQEHYPNQ